jgi:putative lipoprotein
MNRPGLRIEIAVVAVGSLFAGPLMGQTAPASPTAPSGPTIAAPAQAKNNVRRAIEWKQFDYTCQGGAKLTVYLHDQIARVRFQEKAYSMKQTRSADGARYSDGKVVWWDRGNGGVLEEDTPSGHGKTIAKDCALDKPLNTGAVSGTVSYLLRMALPPNAVIEVQFEDVTLADAPAKVIAEERITLGQRQVPVAFELKYDPTKIEAKHKYAVSARILVDGELRFITDQAYPVVTEGKPSHVEMILKQVGTAAPK